MVNDLQAGIYTVTVTDINGCTGTCQAEIIEEDCSMMCDLVLELSADPICDGDVGTITSNLTGTIVSNLEYEWSTGETTNSIDFTTAEQFCLTVTDDGNGCSAEACILRNFMLLMGCANIGRD